MSRWRWAALVVAVAAGAAATVADQAVTVAPAYATESVSHDPDDPAVWVHPAQPSRSLILGTNKAAAPDGALYVFDLRGKMVQRIGGLDRPNNVDVEGSLAMVTERNAGRLRAFRIDARTGQLTDVSGSLAVFAGESERRAAPMGIGIYRRPRDGALFAIVSRKEGPKAGYLWQYRIEENASGKIDGAVVRQFGNFEGTEIEAVAVDDEAGFVYYSDEGCCVRKWHADPDHPGAGREVATFARGFAGQQEGIAVYAAGPGGRGYVIVTEQTTRARYHVFGRGDGNPPAGVFDGGADTTDGIEAVAAPLNLFIAMNSGPKNFLVFRWPAIRRALRLK